MQIESLMIVPPNARDFSRCAALIVLGDVIPAPDEGKMVGARLLPNFLEERSEFASSHREFCVNRAARIAAAPRARPATPISPLPHLDARQPCLKK
jgi:hypothetical protein